ncbi:hypothetical protein F5Y01DRAFT_283860 [Xylaria sp. FL0043]|nr:hypothetical protein F5Y01DRAFT_283860 [Xylaria sp. FL0043]
MHPPPLLGSYQQVDAHADLPQLVQNDKERMDQTFKACGYLADLMARYSRMEAHYWNRGVRQGKPLEDAMLRVYTAILVYSAEVKESTESEGLSQFP